MLLFGDFGCHLSHWGIVGLQLLPLIQAVRVVQVPIEHVIMFAIDAHHDQQWLKAIQCLEDVPPGGLIHEVLAVDEVIWLECIQAIFLSKL